MDKVKGSIEALNSLQLTEDMAGMDVESKKLLCNREVLAVILKGVVAEYEGYSREEIMQFIEPDSITNEMEVSPGRTNTKVTGDRAEFAELNEKVSYFDLAFRAKNPVLSKKDVQVNLHVDMESQKTYRPGYPVEKRGIYYLARRLSSQLSLLMEGTDYNRLEKCYSIWICREDIPPGMRYSLSVYEMTNTKETGLHQIAKENFDLMTLVIIKLGDKVYNGRKEDRDYELLHFLNMIMYPHKKDFMDEISKYIDFSGNEELRKEVKRMSGLGESIFMEGIEEGREQGQEKGIRALILDNLEEKIPENRILMKLQKHFDLTEEKAEAYYKKYMEENISV